MNMDWREQLKNNHGLTKNIIKDLYEILRYNPDLPLMSLLKSLLNRGHRRATRKRLKAYLEDDPNIGSKEDTSSFLNRATVYYLKEGAE
jgi:hypothetical protein